MELLNPPAKRFREAGGDLATSDLTIQSVVAVAELGKPLDVRMMERMYKELERKTGSMEFRFAEKFQGAVMKKQTSEGLLTGLVFPSGRVVCTGAKTEAAAKSAVVSMLNVIKQIVYPNKPLGAIAATEPPKIQSYVGSYEIGFEVQLELFALAHPEDAVYEPEIYPSLIYKPKAAKATVHISPRGKVMITAPSQELISDAQKSVRHLLYRFQRSKFGKGAA
jgi:transcription initiation factor TFIID TATA-box-binding protein